MEIWKNAPSKPEITGGREKYNKLRTELKRINDFIEKADSDLALYENNKKCMNDVYCSVYFKILKTPCAVKTGTFLLTPEFSVSKWNISAEPKVNEVCWKEGTENKNNW